MKKLLTTNMFNRVKADLDAILEDMLSQANAEHGGRFLFGGSQGAQAPFQRNGDIVTYHGDDSELSTAISRPLGCSCRNTSASWRDCYRG